MRRLRELGRLFILRNQPTGGSDGPFRHHCGGTRIEVTAPPHEVTECNCTFCFKRGALWVYYPPDQVTVEAAHGVGYTSDPDLYTHYHCGVCGCTTHSRLACSWSDAGTDFTRPRVALNARLLEDFDLALLPLQKLDGRNAW